MIPARANSCCVTSWPGAALRMIRSAGQGATSLPAEMLPLSSGFTGAALDRGVAARENPRLAHERQARVEVDAGVRVGVGAGGVVDAHRRLVRVGERDLAEGHADVGAVLRGGVDLARPLDRAGGDGLRKTLRLVDVDGHVWISWNGGDPGKACGGESVKSSSSSAGMTRIRFRVSADQPCLSPCAGPPSERHRMSGGRSGLSMRGRDSIKIRSAKAARRGDSPSPGADGPACRSRRAWPRATRHTEWRRR